MVPISVGFSVFPKNATWGQNFLKAPLCGGEARENMGSNPRFGAIWALFGLRTADLRLPRIKGRFFKDVVGRST